MSRYLRNGHDFDDSTILIAETMFERFIDRSLATQEYDERITIIANIGRLTCTPVVEITRVEARCKNWEFASDFGPTEWREIALHDVQERGGRIKLPFPLLGDSYDEARVVYQAGLVDVPTDVEAVVSEIASLVRGRKITEWSGMQSLSDHAQETIVRYRGGA